MDIYGGRNAGNSLKDKLIAEIDDLSEKKVREVMDFIGYLKLKEDEWFIEFVNKRVPGGKAMSFKRTVYTSTIDALDALLRSLAIYEQKYQMSSDEFYASYLAGKQQFTVKAKRGSIRRGTPIILG